MTDLSMKSVCYVYRYPDLTLLIHLVLKNIGNLQNLVPLKMPLLVKTLQEKLTG